MAGRRHPTPVGARGVVGANSVDEDDRLALRLSELIGGSSLRLRCQARCTLDLKVGRKPRRFAPCSA